MIETPVSKQTSWRAVAGASISACALLVTGFGVWGALEATATNSANPQQVTSGTLKLTMTNNGVGFSQNVSNMAPGDTVNRYIELSNSGTLDGKTLTLTVDATGSSALATDGSSPSTTKALKVGVKQCSVAWTYGTGVCSGSTTTLLAPATVGSLSSAASLIAGSFTAGSAVNLQIQLLLPDQDETTVNGTLPSPTIQGATAQLTYTFKELQRTTTTTNS